MSEEKTVHILIRDFFGVVALAFTVFSVMALITYSPDDPSFNKSVTGSNVANSAGMVGAYFSDGLARVFGSGSFFFPVITVFLSWILVRGKDFHNLPLILSSGLLFLVGLCSLLAIQFKVDPFFGSAVPVGGLVGHGLGGFLVAWLNASGAVLTLITLLLVAFLVMTRIPVNVLVEGVGKLFKTLAAASILTAVGIKNMVLKSLSATRIFIDKLQTARQEMREINKAAMPPVIITRSRPEPVAKTEEKSGKKKTGKEKAEFVVQDHFAFMSSPGKYQVPPLSLLEDPPPGRDTQDDKARNEILASSAILEKKLLDFGIDGRVVQVLPGPVITLFEYEPAPGIKVSRIVSLADDLSLALRCVGLRILAPVPGKPVVGIEIPNIRRETIYFKDVMTSDVFQESKSKLTLVIGKDITGEPAVQDLATTPHLLMAGSTGSGKSVGLNAMICSILLNATPEEVKMIMIDPKMLELSIYDGIPHLISPVVTNPKKAAAALQWAVNEMESRYKMMAECGVRNIGGFNELAEKLQKEYEVELKQREKANKGVKPENAEDADDEEMMPEPPAKLPYVVILIDELADLMMVASKGVEDSLTRLAQMARAAGIHLIVATQRPSVDVLTGIIKANFPTRMSYKVTSRVDSRTILDAMGADKLLGKGDMLFLPPGTSKLHRLHGVMVSDEEIQRIVDFIKKQAKPHYQEDIFDAVVQEGKSEGEEEEPYDEKYDEALAIVAKDRQASISYIQRRLRIGYNRAARIIETMEREGVVGPSDGVKPREVYVSPIEIE
ncbi:MAG: DNA translocase FtsK 4TM domain-containing protein [Nitrospinae bacterium]|nr:DNA translocase FtsK 4TM domain-containing protein [Nitrospinota bacterium]MBL7019520.1 DNA translocase FtsK 4TM domain-containing protein [Nitrospinaceae bacterium]